jgi:hypothetical protein
MRPTGPPEERNRMPVREERFDESLRRRPERIQGGRAAHRAQKISIDALNLALTSTGLPDQYVETNGLLART